MQPFIKQKISDGQSSGVATAPCIFFLIPPRWTLSSSSGSRGKHVIKWNKLMNQSMLSRRTVETCNIVNLSDLHGFIYLSVGLLIVSISRQCSLVLDICYFDVSFSYILFWFTFV